MVPIPNANLLSLDLGVYGHSNAETGYRNSTYSMEAVFLTVLDPSSVQIVHRMRSISKSESILTGRFCDPRGVEVYCVSSLAHSADRRTILLRMATGDQQMVEDGDRYMGSLDSIHSSRCVIVKYYPTLLPMIILSAAV